MKSVTEWLWVDDDWVLQGVHYYRCHSETESVPPHQLKYVLEPQQYAALAADPEVEDPLTAADEKVAEYATYYFEYDSNGRVSLRRWLEAR